MEHVRLSEAWQNLLLNLQSMNWNQGGLVKGILAIHGLEQQARAAPRCFDGAGTAHSASSKPWHGMVSLHCISAWRARHQSPVIEMEKAAYDTEFFKS